MAKQNNIRKSWLFHDYFARLKSIALSVYKWEGLPESCNARFLEECLFRYGQASFVKDPEMSFLNLKITPSTALNVYEEPTSFTVFSTGYNRIYDADECVWIKNNYLCKSTESTLLIYAERLAKIQLAVETNIAAQKTPILIQCDEKTRMSLQTVYDKYEGDAPVIFGTKGLSESPITAIVTGAPFVAEKLRYELRAVWNEAMEFLGINTNPAEFKRERLVTTEISANNEQVDIQALTMLLCRQQACDLINARYGLSVKVTQRVDELHKLLENSVRLYGNIPDEAMEEVLQDG